MRKNILCIAMLVLVFVTCLTPLSAATLLDKGHYSSYTEDGLKLFSYETYLIDSNSLIGYNKITQNGKSIFTKEEWSFLKKDGQTYVRLKGYYGYDHKWILNRYLCGSANTNGKSLLDYYKWRLTNKIFADQVDGYSSLVGHL
jgi:hypothetical protein